MPTPRQGYKTKDGSRVPSVTTILGRYKESGALIHWAWNLGKEGQDYRQVRDNAADAGTVAHTMIERWLRGEPADDIDAAVDVYARGRNGFENFLRWAEEARPRVIETEVYLVSEAHRFGGTFDAVIALGDSDELILADWKTSKAVYDDHVWQMAAYGLLWRENFPDRKISGYRLMRFDKETMAFEGHVYGDLSASEAHFLNLNAAYQSEKLAKKESNVKIAA